MPLGELFAICLAALGELLDDTVAPVSFLRKLELILLLKGDDGLKDLSKDLTVR